MERIECSTPDITQENIERLTELFPSVVTETTDADGNPQKAIDFDALRELLGDVAEGQRERYQFTWPGKREAKSLARTPCDKTMRPHALDGMVSNGLETKVPANKLNDNFERKEFQELWGRIHGKYVYTVEFDSAELVDHAVARIDKDLMVSELAYAMTVGTQHDELQRDDLDAGQFKVRRTAQEKVDAGAVTGVTYDLLGEVAAQASITRRTAAAILAKIHPAKFSLYAKNPEEFIAKVAKLIVSEKATMVVDHVEYRKRQK